MRRGAQGRGRPRRVDDAEAHLAARRHHGAEGAVGVIALEAVLREALEVPVAVRAGEDPVPVVVAVDALVGRPVVARVAVAVAVLGSRPKLERARVAVPYGAAE